MKRFLFLYYFLVLYINIYGTIMFSWMVQRTEYKNQSRYFRKGIIVNQTS